MLKHLFIKNYALYRELSIDFPGQLSVITGETGAGKSIFLEALGLALGNRADSLNFYDRNEKCVVEAIFNIEKVSEAKAFLEENDFDNHSELILRRELSREGKSRSFINDSPSSLQQIKLLSQFLIDVHSQHQSLLINQQRFQFKLIDSLSGSERQAGEYAEKFKKYLELKKEFESLKAKEFELKKELDYLNFQLTELQEASLDNKDVAKLEEEYSTLENAENICAILNQCTQLMDNEAGGILQQINQLKTLLRSTESFGNSLVGLSSRLLAVQEELKDFSFELVSKESSIEINPKKLEEVRESLDTINRLLLKHQAKDVNSLIALKNAIEKKVSVIEGFDGNLTNLESQLNATKKECIELASALSKNRTKSFTQIEKKVAGMLHELSMPNARFKIENNEQNEIGINGIDSIEFYFSANLGVDLSPIQKAASGGELSRLMLCLKSLLASSKALPTIIFDEIDTGVSGDVANKMGKIFSKMSKEMQVLTITHLPQIASCGNHHLFVYKYNEGKKTSAEIKELKGDERIVEIAKMLSTDSPTESAIKNAKDLLQSN
ncbi:MAG: DNA repair protein RecN [Bacteroidia bacterium]